MGNVFARVDPIVFVVMAIAAAIVSIIHAIYLLANTTNTVIKTTITSASTEFNTAYLGVTYVVNNQTYNKILQTSPLTITGSAANYKVGDKIKISYSYDPDMVIFGDGRDWVSIFLYGIGGVGGLSCLGSLFYLVYKYKDKPKIQVISN